MEDYSYEAHKDSQFRQPEGKRLQGRLRRMPGILPVRLQDLLHRCQSEVREKQLIRLFDVTFSTYGAGCGLPLCRAIFDCKGEVLDDT